MPFLSADLYDLLKTLMTRVLNVVTTITNAAKLCDVNVFDVDNQQHYKKVDVGFSVERILKNLKEDKKISKQHEMELTAKRLQKDIAALAKSADMYAVQVEEKSDWTLVGKCHEKVFPGKSG